MRRLFVVAALLALVAASCKIETNIGATINADGSGTIVAEIGLDEEAQGFFLSDGSDPFEGNDLATMEGARTRTETRGGLTYYIIEADVADVADMEQSILGNENTLLSTFDVSVSDNLVSITGTATAADAFGGEDTSQFDPSVLQDSVSARVFFTMPGKILSDNADERDGNTLYWDVPILGGDLNIQAQSDPTGTPSSGGSGGGGFPTWLIIVIVAAVLAAGWYFMNQRNKAAPQEAAEAMGDAEEAMAPAAEAMGEATESAEDMASDAGEMASGAEDMAADEMGDEPPPPPAT